MVLEGALGTFALVAMVSIAFSMGLVIKSCKLCLFTYNKTMNRWFALDARLFKYFLSHRLMSRLYAPPNRRSGIRG